METMGDLELFLNDESVTLPILIKAALAHVQFETIPLLYLSLYFKTHRHPYYDHLQSVRETGNWEAWITFFLEGVIETAGQAVDTARTVLNQFAVDQRTIATSGRSTGAIVTVFSYLQRHPIATATSIKSSTGLSLPTILRALTTLSDLKMVHEITGKGRHKIFAYQDYLDILNQGTEPLGR